MRLSACLLAAMLVAACDRPPPGDTGRIRVSEALGGGDDAGYERALAPRAFTFPADHGPHPGFKHEWWYLTGNLDGGDGHRYGYQLTFFRIALAPAARQRDSRWAAHQVWMGHLAITDVAARRHLAAERIVRDALGLAGARTEGRRIWVEDWELRRDAGGRWHIAAGTSAFRLDLDLDPRRPPVLQGDAGLSRKGAAPGNASYYYSLPRLATTGTVTMDGETRRVSGLSWLDREWSTSALEPGQTGWDWFSLQLADGTDIMYYRLRRANGGPDPHSRGTLIRPDGSRQDLLPAGVSLSPRTWWTGPGGGRYPVEWDVALDEPDRRLRIRAVIPDQLMDLSVRYWEGAVDVFDQRSNSKLGRGYLEMTGYSN